MHKINCPCQHTSLKSPCDAITEFKALRESCPALRTILIPDLAEWERACADLDQDSSGHRSILLGAFKRGCLQRLTLPIHRYLMEGDSPRSDLTAQYKKDLQERWFIRPDPLNRHKKSKGYLGRSSELLIAQWAENTTGLTIIGLEATGSKHDILTVSIDGIEGAIEVKFIGTMDADFEKMLTMKIFGGARDLKTTSDFLLSRIYEAAKQLSDYQYRKTAIIVVDEMAWNLGFDAARDFGYVDLRNPRFQSTNKGWLKYLQSLKDSYPQIESDLALTILSLGGRIHVFRLSAADETIAEEPFFSRRHN